MKTTDVPPSTQLELLGKIERVIEQNLNDPDMLARSSDFRAGYAQGMREVMVVHLKRLIEQR